jgi:hypothetical protein
MAASDTSFFEADPWRPARCRTSPTFNGEELWGRLDGITDPAGPRSCEDEHGSRNVRSTAVSENKPWYPNLEKAKEFTDHTNPALGGDPPLRIPLANEDTAPLQGTKDLSDEDSLEDVIAESYEPEAEAPPTVSADGTKLPPEKFRP